MSFYAHLNTIKVWSIPNIVWNGAMSAKSGHVFIPDSWPTNLMNFIAGIYDSAHLIFHGPSVHRKISVRNEQFWRIQVY